MYRPSEHSRGRGPCGSPLRPSAATIGDCSSSLVPSPSPEPFSGTGGHHVCGAGRPSALACAEMPSGTVAPLATPGRIPPRPPFRQRRSGGAGDRYGSWGPDDGRDHPGAQRDRARRPAAPPSNSCRWSTTSCASWRPRSWPRRSRARRSRPPPWSTRRTCGWWPAAEPAQQHWDSRGHFFAAAAEAMRRILVDQARDKRPAQARRRLAARATSTTSTSPSPNRRTTCSPSTRPWTSWPQDDPASAELVKLRYFAGLTLEEAAEALGISAAPPTATGPTPGPGSTPRCARTRNRRET